MNTLKNLRNDYVAIEVAYNDLDMVGDTVVLADLCKIEAETLFPNKSRALRRKQTAKKHSRLDKVIEDVYPVKDCNKHNLKKTIKSNKGWYIYDDLRKDNLAEQIAEGLAEYSYQTKVADFYKLVDQYNSTKYILKWSELVENEYLEDFGTIYDIVDESLEFNNLEDVHLHIAEAFNEEWEPTYYEIVKVSCDTKELVDRWFSEAVDIPDDDDFFIDLISDEEFPFE